MPATATETTTKGAPARTRRQRTTADAKATMPTTATPAKTGRPRTNTSAKTGEIKPPARTGRVRAASASTPTPTSGATSQINFRADDETKAALDALTQDGTSVSEVIRKAIKDARWAALRAEAIAQAKRDSEDPKQIAIMEQVRKDMDSIGAW